MTHLHTVHTTSALTIMILHELFLPKLIIIYNHFSMKKIMSSITMHVCTVYVCLYVCMYVTRMDNA